MGQRFRANGRTFDIPEDKVDSFLADMPDASPDDGGGSAQTSAATRFSVDGKQYDIPPDKVDAFRQSMQASGKNPEALSHSSGGPQNHVIEMPTQTILGDVPQPDWSDKLKAGAAGYADQLFAGTPRMLPGGLGERFGQNVDAAIAKAPGWGAGGRMVGGLAQSAFIPGGGIAANAVGAGVTGTVDSYAHGDPNDPERAMNALAAGGKDALTAGTFSAAAPLITRGAQGLRNSSYVNRARAALGDTGVDKLVAKKGEGAVEAIGQRIDEAKLGRGLLPGNQARYVGNAAQLEAEAGPRMGAAEDAISTLASPPTVPVGDIVQRQRDAAQKLGGMYDPGAAREARFRNAMADRIEGNTPNVVGQGGNADWNSALDNRRYLDKQINYERRAGARAPMQEDVRSEVANDLRGGVKNSLNQGVDNGTVPPELAHEWIGANDDFALGKQVQKFATPNTPGLLGRALPYAVGGAGVFSGHPVLGAAAGAGTKAAIGGMQGRGASMIAGMQGMGAAGLEAAAGPQAGARMDAMGRAFRDQQTSPAQSTGQGRGNKLGEAALSALQNNPQIFGQWQAEFAQAASSPEPGAVNALISRLAQKDPEFRAGPLQQLQQMTAQE